MSRVILNTETPNELIGGKARNLFRLNEMGAIVPAFCVITNDLFQNFLEKNQINAPQNISEELIVNGVFSTDQSEEIRIALEKLNLKEEFLAIRSSGLDEDSSDHSFAGMFSSFLYQKEFDDILVSIKKCWASAYSQRCIAYREKNKLNTVNIGMGVVIQKMVNSEKSGVAFSHNPIDLTDRDHILIESVWGQCEGLVSGMIDADQFHLSRTNNSITKKIAQKEKKLIAHPEKPGLKTIELNSKLSEQSSLEDQEVVQIGELTKKLMTSANSPVDIEWAIEDNQLYLVQMRPITNIPGLSFYSENCAGIEATLWDNSNIVESFSGVTTPLTFSLTKDAYDTVYRETCRLLNVPENLIAEHDNVYKNMLGFIRGRVYYNLINWYKLLFLIPGFSSNKEFMETMMGVKAELDNEQQKIFSFLKTAPKYSALSKINVMGKLFWHFWNINKNVKAFSSRFDKIYQEYKKKSFKSRSLKQLKNDYEKWNDEVSYNWETPIVNDFLVMMFYGTLKKLTEKWIEVDSSNMNLQNDLLCGQGDIDSTLPTKTLMQMAGEFDGDEKTRELFLSNDSEKVLLVLNNGEFENVKQSLQSYLDLYGFRCSNEQKLEENDLSTHPEFVIDSLRNYIRNKNYDIVKMSQNEEKLRSAAEKIVNAQLGWGKKFVFKWVLKHTRVALRNRENMRFLRSKSFGTTRRLFQAVASHLKNLDVIDNEAKAYYLDYKEIFDFIEGKPCSLELNKLATIRFEEYIQYRNEDDPPDRFLTYGAVGVSFKNVQAIKSGDLLKGKIKVSDDPALVYGVSCCPGVVKAQVRVASCLSEAKDLNGEILIAQRTDPGWVPLFPSCSGLIVERGSLLSHSAVVAREIGLPTIVGVSENVLKKFNNGDWVELNATTGEIRILDNAQG